MIKGLVTTDIQLPKFIHKCFSYVIATARKNEFSETIKE